MAGKGALPLLFWSFNTLEEQIDDMDASDVDNGVI